MTFFYISIFIASFFILALSSKWLVKSLASLARFLGWKEFVVAFFTMALAGAIPNLLVGMSSVFHRIPQLSFSEIVGGNIIDLTLAVALAALISRNGLKLPGQTVQGSAVFTLAIAIMPILLIFDGQLSRLDGIILILGFVIYTSWLFNKKERFSKAYNKMKNQLGLRAILNNIGTVLGAIFLLILSAEGIVRSATYFSTLLNFPIVLIGILVVGVGNAMPEIFFSFQAARRGRGWLVVGNLMGSVIVPATLVLGLVAILSPIKITNLSPFAISRFFLIVSAIFFLLFLRTGRRISKKEALILLIIYILFVLAEILFT